MKTTTTKSPKIMTAAMMPDDLREDLDRYAAAHFDGNRSLAMRMLLRQALATDRQQAA
jgi:hypothetical protein